MRRPATRAFGGVVVSDSHPYDIRTSKGIIHSSHRGLPDDCPVCAPKVDAVENALALEWCGGCGHHHAIPEHGDICGGRTPERGPGGRVHSAKPPKRLNATERLAVAAVHPFKGPYDTDASMLREAALRARDGYPVGGSNTRATVDRVLRLVADLIEEADRG